MGGDLGGMYSFVPRRKFGFITIVPYRVLVQKSMRHYYFNLQLQRASVKLSMFSFFLSFYKAFVSSKRRLVYIYIYIYVTILLLFFLSGLL